MTGRGGEERNCKVVRVLEMNDERDDGMRTSYDIRIPGTGWHPHMHLCTCNPSFPYVYISQPHMAQHRHLKNYSQLTTGESSKESFACPPSQRGGSTLARTLTPEGKAACFAAWMASRSLAHHKTSYQSMVRNLFRNTSITRRKSMSVCVWWW